MDKSGAPQSALDVCPPDHLESGSSNRRLVADDHRGQNGKGSDFSWYLILSTFTAILGAFQFGYNTGVINAPLTCNYNRSSTNMSPDLIVFVSAGIVAIFAIGGMGGGFIGAWWANYFGRKRGLMWNSVIGVIAGGIMMVSKYVESYEVLALGRLIVGFSCGIYTGLVPTYISEIAPKEKRGALGTLNQFAVVLGILISQLLGLNFLLGTTCCWNILVGLSAIVALSQLALLPLIPESPRFLLISRKQESEALAVLKQLRHNVEEENVNSEISDMKAERDEAESVTELTITQLLRAKSLRLPLLISIVMHFSQQLSGINAIFYYSSNLFEKAAGMTKTEAGYATIAVGGIMVLMTFITIPLMDRIGRRKLHLTGVAGMLLCLIIVTILLAIPGSDAMKKAAVAFCLLFVLFFALGPGSIPWMIVAELFSQGPRSAAVGLGVLVNWFCNFVVGLSFPPIEKAMKHFCFVPFAVLLTIFFVFLWKYLPETKGKTFDEIAAMFRKQHQTSKHEDEAVAHASISPQNNYGNESVILIDNNRKPSLGSNTYQTMG